MSEVVVVVRYVHRGMWICLMWCVCNWASRSKVFYLFLWQCQIYHIGGRMKHQCKDNSVLYLKSNLVEWTKDAIRWVIFQVCVCACVPRWMYRGFQIGITVECMGWWSWFYQTSCRPTSRRYSPPVGGCLYMLYSISQWHLQYSSANIHCVQKFSEIFEEIMICVQCFDTWFGFRKSIRPVKIEWWGACMIIWLDWGADYLHMVQLMPLPPRYLLLH